MEHFIEIVVVQSSDALLAGLQRWQVLQWAIEPAAQETASHGGGAGVQYFK